MHSFPLQLIIPIAVLGLALGACSRGDNGQPMARRPERQSVTVSTVTNTAWDKTVSIVGTLYPKDQATLSAQVEGAVEKTMVEFGDRVSQDQDLAFIDTATYEAQLEQAAGNLAKAVANLANAQQSFDRVQRLKAGGIASESDYDQARAQLSQWEAEVKAARGAESVARLNLDHSKVKAPFDGAISQRIVGRGDFVKVGSPLFDMVNDAVLKFIFQVPERYASQVEKQLPVTFTVDNYPGETFTGTVYLISPSVSTTSRSFNVGALVTNTGFRLKANTFGRGEITVQRGVPTPVAPIESIVSFAGVTKVFVIEGETARSRPVTAGRVRDGVQEILEGLKAGDVVVVGGQSKLADGMPVTVQMPGASGKASEATSAHAQH